MNLQQVTGELDDGELIDETKLQKVAKRITGVGVAMKEVKDGTVSLRDPMQVLEELAQVYNSLPDDSVEKVGIISDLGGKIYLVAQKYATRTYLIAGNALEPYPTITGKLRYDGFKT